jgi:hypothetical protein
MNTFVPVIPFVAQSKPFNFEGGVLLSDLSGSVLIGR